MKQLFILTIICLTFVQTLEAQTRAGAQDMYFFCSAVTDTKEGIRRGAPKFNNDPLYVSAPIQFRMISMQKDIYIGFDNYNYNPTELSKIRPVVPAEDQMEIMLTSRSTLKFINALKPITLEDKLASFRTKEEAWAWVKSIKATGQRIYILDWNDPVNKGSAQIKLIQVRPTVTNRPLY